MDSDLQGAATAMTDRQSRINDFQSAIGFITILPAGKTVRFSPMGMIRFFPVVGLVLGLLLTCADAMVSIVWPGFASAVLDVLFLVAVTGAFHLDGLGDSADGLFSHRSRERALEIMKDSRTGMMGLVAVVCILLLKTAGIYSMKLSCSGPGLALFLICIPSLARSGMLFGIRFLPYGRTGTGTGRALFEEPLAWHCFSWSVMPVVTCLFLGLKGVMVLLVWASTVFLILWFYKRKMGCITGDMLGAMTEVTEAVLFMAAGAGLH